MSNQLTVVIKASKLCNLRCSYCYEYSNLSNPDRIDPDNLILLFAKVKQLSELLKVNVKFCWHGGEPTLLPTKYLREAINNQLHTFGGQPTNVIQSNIFRLSEDVLTKLSLFDFVSISFDAFGVDRVNVAGKDVANKIITNMDIMKARGIQFGVVNVVTKYNVADADRLFEFYRKSELSVRFLPYYREASEVISLRYGVSMPEVRDFLLRIMDLWFTKGKGKLKIFPIDDFIRIAISFLQRSQSTYVYDKKLKEHVLIVDTTGDVYAAGTTYHEQYLYGNIFYNTVEDLLDSSGRSAAVDRSRTLMEKCCSQCKYLGHCSGYYVGELTFVELRLMGSDDTCPIARPCIDRAVEWLSPLCSQLEKQGWVADEAQYDFET